MSQGIKAVIFPVKDLARAKSPFSRLAGTEPHTDTAYYVGFRVGDQEIGLDPNCHSKGISGPLGLGARTSRPHPLPLENSWECGSASRQILPLPYWHVADIRKSLRALLDGGAQLQQDVRDVGGGRLIASVKDPDGNGIGLLQAS